MKNILSDIKNTIIVTIIGAVVLCGIYPVVISYSSRTRPMAA